ncbi:hypothetical protein CLU79DRAFT_720202 [Phycomyces nitens]|nr:hypothetical protein CLU79DRAFT_720202 [Phycomyces nitens]
MDKYCKVCSSTDAKYKCPKCKILYCSLACYKVHKSTPCESNDPVKEQLETESIRKEIPFEDEEDESRLSEEKLSSLLYANELRPYLKYPQIRELITKIDTSNDPEKDLDAARASDEIFDEFVKKILDVVSDQKK